MEKRHLEAILEIDLGIREKVHVLNIEDHYTKNSTTLVGQLILRMSAIFDIWN